MLTVDQSRQGTVWRIGDSHTLARESIALEEGVPVLSYAIVNDTLAGPVLESFNIDRLDGKERVVYPEPGERLMIVE